MAVTPCPVCGTVNRPGAQFCTRCRTSLSASTSHVTPPLPPPPPPAQSTAAVSPPAAQITCPNCGKPNRSTAKRCAHCGNLLATLPLNAPPPPPPMPAPTPTPPPAPRPIAQPPAVPTPPPVATPVAPKRRTAFIVPAILLVCLVVALCGSLSGIFVVESSQPTATPKTVVVIAPTLTFTPPPPPPTVPPATFTPTATPNPPFPVVAVKITGDGRFGFRTLQGDPGNSKDDNKPLTFRRERTNDIPDGGTNNTRFSIDGKTPLFGGKDGQFIQPPKVTDSDSKMFAVWQYQKIVITQTVEVVLSASTHRLDTFKITYAAENRDAISHTVGVRLMIDTLIGDNDGVPFVVPGRTGLVSSPLDLRGADIPNFIQVYENLDLANPGVTLQLTLTGGDATTPDRVVLAPWCKPDAGWDFFAEEGGAANRTMRQCGDQGIGAQDNKLDSAVGIYFDPKALAAGETREWTTFYGLGAVKRQVATSALSLAKPPERVNVGEEFWLVALVQNPQAGQTVKIVLPAEFQLMQNPVEQAVVPGTPLTQVSWRVRAVKPGNSLALNVELMPGGQKESAQVSVLALPTPTLTATPKPCATSVTKPTCP